jgi:hypothetical protein
MPTKQEYSGWFNFETWNVALWINNDQGSQEMSKELAENTKNEDKEQWAVDLGDAIEQWIEDGKPEIDGTYLDILNAGLREVNWREIAESIIEGMDEEERYQKSKKVKPEGTQE